MNNEGSLIQGFRELGLKEGMNLIVHTSSRVEDIENTEDIENSVETLLNAIQAVLGDSGTLIVPSFTDVLRYPIELGKLISQQPNSKRSDHPAFSFSAIGENAEYLTREAPFHFPLGSDSPLARLHQLGGYILLLGADHTLNISIHLAEIWAEMPYIHRNTTLEISQGTWSKMRGNPECGAGFRKIESILSQARLIKRGTIGDISVQLLSQRDLVSMAIAILRGNSAALLCDNPECRSCLLARKWVSK